MSGFILSPDDWPFSFVRKYNTLTRGWGASPVESLSVPLLIADTRHLIHL